MKLDLRKVRMDPATFALSVFALTSWYVFALHYAAKVTP